MSLLYTTLLTPFPLPLLSRVAAGYKFQSNRLSFTFLFCFVSCLPIPSSIWSSDGNQINESQIYQTSCYVCCCSTRVSASCINCQCLFQMPLGGRDWYNPISPCQIEGPIKNPIYRTGLQNNARENWLESSLELRNCSISCRVGERPSC